MAPPKEHQGSAGRAPPSVFSFANRNDQMASGQWQMKTSESVAKAATEEEKQEEQGPVRKKPAPIYHSNIFFPHRNPHPINFPDDPFEYLGPEPKGKKRKIEAEEGPEPKKVKHEPTDGKDYTEGGTLQTTGGSTVISDGFAPSIQSTPMYSFAQGTGRQPTSLAVAPSAVGITQMSQSRFAGSQQKTQPTAPWSATMTADRSTGIFQHQPVGQQFTYPVICRPLDRLPTMQLRSPGGYNVDWFRRDNRAFQQGLLTFPRELFAALDRAYWQCYRGHSSVLSTGPFASDFIYSTRTNDPLDQFPCNASLQLANEAAIAVFRRRFNPASIDLSTRDLGDYEQLWMKAGRNLRGRTFSLTWAVDGHGCVTLSMTNYRTGWHYTHRVVADYLSLLIG